MNVIFACILMVSVGYMTFTAPELILSAMTSGAEKALKLAAGLTAIYSVWLGIFELLERSGLTEKLSKLAYKPVKRIFGNVDDSAAKYLALNVTANIIGLSSVATPMGIKAAAYLDEKDNEYAKAMLFAVAATSLQILPTTVISLRDKLGSVSSYDIVLPTLLSTLVSTVCGILLTAVFVKR